MSEHLSEETYERYKKLNKQKYVEPGTVVDFHLRPPGYTREFTDYIDNLWAIYQLPLRAGPAMPPRKGKGMGRHRRFFTLAPW